MVVVVVIVVVILFSVLVIGVDAASVVVDSVEVPGIFLLAACFSLPNQDYLVP